MIVEKVYRSCLVTFVGSNTHIDLAILEMVDFDVIRGMTLLSPNFSILDCNAKTVTLAKPGTDPLVWFNVNNSITWGLKEITLN